MSNTASLSFKKKATFDDLLDRKYLGKKDYIWFSLTQFACSAITGLAQGYLLFFYTSIMNIPLTYVGTMFLIAKIWDGINDPIMGVIVDKTRSKMGKMRPYLLWASIPYAACTILMFINFRGMSSVGKIVFMYVTYILFSTVGTAVEVPLQGLPAVVSPNVDERTKIISISRILGSIGEQSALVLISFGLLVTNDNYEFTYTGTAVVIGVIAPIFMVISALVLKERIEPTNQIPFLILICSNLLTFFRNLVSAAIMYVVAYIYGNGSLQIAFALPGAVASMIGMLFAPKLKRHFNAKQLFIIATIWHSVCSTVYYRYDMAFGVLGRGLFRRHDCAVVSDSYIDVLYNAAGRRSERSSAPDGGGYDRLLGTQDRSAPGRHNLFADGTAQQGFQRIERLFPDFLIRLFPVQPTFGIRRGSRSGAI